MFMKVMDVCRGCLDGLARKTIELSSGDEELLSRCRACIGLLWEQGTTPPGIANRLLKFISEATGVSDPFAAMKEIEFDFSRKALKELEGAFPPTIEGALKFSALGNSGDFFVEGSYDPGVMQFEGDVDKIEQEFYSSPEEVLIIGDNISDFVFDIMFIRYLEKCGKRAYYAIREYPIQNDLCISDVRRFGLRNMFEDIISTGTGEVGIRREAMTGKIKELWEGPNLVVAKGMGNYETMSEYCNERPVIHIMKIKCNAVSADTGIEKGTYVAMI